MVDQLALHCADVEAGGGCCSAVGTGTAVLHEPRVWPEYHPDHVAACVRDPDGTTVEVVCGVPS